MRISELYSCYHRFQKNQGIANTNTTNISTEEKSMLLYWKGCGWKYGYSIAIFFTIAKEIHEFLWYIFKSKCRILQLVVHTRNSHRLNEF